MELAVFIENKTRTDFLYLPGTDKTEDLSRLLKHAKIGELLIQTGLENSCLSTFVDQIVTKKAVEKDLIFQGSEALKSELDILYTALPKKLNEWGDDVTIDISLTALNGQKAVPVPYRAYWFTKMAFDWIPALSYEGYNLSSPMGLLSVNEPCSVKGESPIHSTLIDWRMRGPLAAINYLSLQSEEPQITDFVNQYGVRYGRNREPVSVSEESNWSLGSWGESTGFVPRVTVLHSGIKASIEASYASKDLS